MAWIIITFGGVITLYCLCALIVPNILRKTLDFLAVGSRLYSVGILRLCLGVMLLFLTAGMQVFWGYVLTSGVLFAASGLALFFFPLKRIKTLILRFKNQPHWKLRILATLTLTIWALLLYALLMKVSVLPLL